MKNNKKTVIAIVITLVMVLAIVPITVFAGTGASSEDPYVRADKNNGVDAHCLVLYQCDEQGTIIQSLAKYDSSSQKYGLPLSGTDTIYVKVAYADGSVFDTNDWVFRNASSEPKAVQTKQLLIVANGANNDRNVTVNGVSFKDSNPKRVWFNLGEVYKIDFDTNGVGGGSSIGFCLGDGTAFSPASQFGTTLYYWCAAGAPDSNKTGIDAATIADIPDQAYTGQAITPELDISYNGKTLVKDTDYTVEFAKNTEIGEATATITGIGNYDWHVTKTFNIVSAEPVAPKFTLTSSEGADLKAKKNTTLTVNVENGKVEDYTYKFIVYNKTTNQWYRLRDFDAANTFNWYTGPGGEKTLYADVKQGDEIIKRVELGVNVTESTLKVDSFTISPEGDLPAKSQAKLTATASGGAGEYQYKFIVFNATTNQWYKLKDFGPESTFDWYTGPEGKKTLYVDVKDADGTVVRAPLDVTVA